MKALALSSLVLLSSAFFVGRVSPSGSVSSMIIVPDDFLSIQAAVDAASVGDTVFVRAGIYHENVVVTKSILLVGEDADNTIIDWSAAGGELMSIAADNVTVSGFTVTSNIDGYCAGIVLRGSSFCNISKNVITDNCYGIVLDLNSSNNLLFSNYIAKCEYGINCWLGARSNRFIGNTVFRCGIAIVMLRTANESVVFNNRFIHNFKQVHCLSSPNTWDNGYPSGGNYWDDYLGTDSYQGPNQDMQGSDGIGDRPYTIEDVRLDRYPLFVSGKEADARFHTEPSSVTVMKGQTFNVTVQLDNMPEYPGFVGIEFHISWDSSLLNGIGMTDVLFRSVTSEDELGNIWALSRYVTAGCVSYCYLWQDGWRAIFHEYAPIWGNHSVATITLKAVGEGTCMLNVDVVKIGSSSLRELVHVSGNYDSSLLNNSLLGSVIEVRHRNPGDSNGDNVVDIYDATSAARAFGACAGDMKYNELSDENQDGIIDTFDIITVANNFGKTYA